MGLSNTFIQTRDSGIDFFRGLCILSVILIHTAFHSGEAYVPGWVRSVVLLFDVPVFFFLTGCTLSIKSNIDPIKQMAKLAYLFFFVVLVMNLLCGSLTIDNALSPLFLGYQQVKLIPGFSYACWFIQTYIVALLFSLLFIKTSYKFIEKLLLILIPIYYIYSYLTGQCLTITSLGVSVQMLLFYIWTMLLGYNIYKQKNIKNYLYILIIIFSLCYYILGTLYFKDLNLQVSKFILSLPYAICSLPSFCIIMLLKDKVKNNFIEYIGSKTIYLYIAQCIGTSLLFYIAPLIHCNWVLKFIICFIIALTLSLIIAYIIMYTENYILNIIHKLNTNR